LILTFGIVKWDTKNISSSFEGDETQRIWFCARTIGPVRLLLLIPAIALFTVITEGEVDDWKLKSAWAVFVLAVLIMVFLSQVQVLSATSSGIFKPSRFGPQRLCDTSEVLKMKKTSVGAFGYYFWTMEYQFSAGISKKLRFVPRKRGKEFETFLSWVRKANSAAMIDRR